MSKLKILLAHNRYLISGGERQVFEAELGLLRDNGHEVEVYLEDNARVAELGHARTAVRTVWSTETNQRVKSLLNRDQFDLVHVHNFFPLISPSIYYAAKGAGVPVVQTLHNFRLLCLNGNLFRDGAVCEACVGHSVPWSGIRHACYKESRGGSASVAAMLSTHRAAKTWHRMIDSYIALSEFSRQKLIEGGLPGDKISVKPNFVPNDPGLGSGQGGFALYVGRLSAEKGIETMLSAWQTVGGTIPLKIVGDGPLSDQVNAAASSLAAVDYLGRLGNDKVLNLMREAMMLVFPSMCYENFPMTIVEAFAAGLPVVASNMGNAANLITDRQTGMHFRPGDAADLAAQAAWLLQHPEARQQMRQTARTTYEQYYTPSQNYSLLSTIYENTLANVRNGRSEDGENERLSGI